jgi:cellulose synthase (UDP-forming)
MDHSRLTPLLGSDRVLVATLVATAALLALAAWVGVDASAQFWLAGSLIAFLLLARRHSERGTLRLLYLGVIAFLMARYFFWRTFNTLGWQDPFSFAGMMLLYLAECYAIVLGLLSMLVTLRPIDRKPVPLPADSALLPTVDVFVPTYDEAPALVESTLIAACQMDYPAAKLTVYLLDDGGTTQKCNDVDPLRAATARARQLAMRELCRDTGAVYLTREHNEAAKAGNINSALPRSHGELVVILDADHVPTSDFLQKTVGHFLRDPNLFLVQTPHFFINPDPVEKNLDVFSRMPAESEMFFRITQRGLDFWNGTLFAGSAAVLRRRCLDAIGGFAGSSVTEDAETALELHSLGYNSLFVSEPLISGLAPESFEGFVRQRTRWATGMVQILLLKNPLRRAGLTAWQKVCYLTSCLHWLFPFARVVFLLAPLLFLLFGLHIYNASVAEILAFTVPHYWATLRLASFQYGHVRWPFASTLYELLQSMFSLRAIWRVMRNPRAPTFLVTPKGEQLAEDFISPLALPFYLVFAVLMLGAGVGAYRYFAAPDERHMVLIVGFWHALNILIMVAALGVMAELRQRRGSHRVRADLPATMVIEGRAEPCQLRDVSLGGAGLEVANMGRGVRVGSHGLLQVVARRGSASLVLAFTVSSVDCGSGRGRLGVAFERDSAHARARIVQLVYGDSERWRRYWDGRRGNPGPWRSLLLLVWAGCLQSQLHASHLVRGLGRWLRTARSDERAVGHPRSAGTTGTSIPARGRARSTDRTAA